LCVKGTDCARNWHCCSSIKGDSFS
jgi:hypothetical protein